MWIYHVFLVLLSLHHAGPPEGEILSGAIHCDMTIIITVKPSYAGTIVGHVASFLALKTFIIITGHDIY